MNKIFLIGNLTRDPELRVTQSGIPVCGFGIAVNRIGGSQNQNQNQTEFFSISAWRALGENCSRYLKKGNKVCVVGSLSSRSYDAQDGTKRFVMEVNAENVEFLTSPSAGGAAQGGYNNAEAPVPQSSAAMPIGTPVFDDDDPLPF